MDGCKSVRGLYKQSKCRILGDFDTIDIQRIFFLQFEGVRTIDAIKALISQIFMATPILFSSSKRLFLG